MMCDNLIIVQNYVLVNEKGGVNVKKKKVCEFGITAKTKLVQISQTQTWLAERINEKTGLYVDVPYLCKIFTGERSSPRVIQAIREILELPEDASKTA